MTVQSYPLPFQGFDDHDSFSLEPQYGTLFRNVRSNRRFIGRSPGGTLMAPSPMPSGITSAVVSGSLVTPTVTGSQSYVHSLGDIPLAYVFIMSEAPLDSEIVNTNYTMIGFSDGTTRGAHSNGANNGSNPTTVSEHANTTTCILMTDTSNNVIIAGDVTAQDASTFTINWTAVDSVEHTVDFMILGGTGTVSAKVVNWNLPAALGNHAVTGVGFVPQIVLHLGRGGTYAVGGMTPSAQFSQEDKTIPGASPSTAQRITSTAKAFVGLTGIVSLAPALDFSFVYVSMDADGFTVNCDNAPPSIAPITSLCIKGMGGASIGGFAKTTGSAPLNQSVTGVGFKPDLIFLAGTGCTSNAPQSDAIQSFGFTSATDVSTYARMSANGTATKTGGEFSTDAIYVRMNTNRVIKASATLQSFDADGFTLNWPINDVNADHMAYVAFKGGAGTPVGVIRNYAQVYVGTGLTVAEKLLMLTSKSAFIYAPSDSSTGIWTPTTEIYTGTDTQRFSIVNTQSIAAWSQGKDNIRQWDGTTFSSLVTAGQNHAAKALIAFADRIVSIRPFFGGVDHETQIRWCIDGNVNNWTAAGSGALEVIETSQDPLVTGFVLGSRAYLAKQRELIELIWTGTTSPVFGTTPRVRGMGVLAPFSVGLAEQFAFWLGPDDIYMWDGSTLTPIGDRVYNTIDPVIDYSNLDTIQGAVYTPDSLYQLVVPPYLFTYDYRRDIWYQDDTTNFEAIGIFRVGANFTADIDNSEFPVIGDSFVQTVRLDKYLTNYLGAPIDSYWTTKDYTADELMGTAMSRGFRVSLWNINSLREIRFQSNAGYLVEVGVSVDRGVTWQTFMVTTNAQGTGVAWFQIPFNQVRFRFRNYGTVPYEIHGTWGTDTEDSGYMYP